MKWSTWPIWKYLHPDSLFATFNVQKLYETDKRLHLVGKRWAWEAPVELAMLKDTLLFRQVLRSWGTGTTQRTRRQARGRGSSRACCRSAWAGGKPPGWVHLAGRRGSDLGLLRTPPCHAAGASTLRSPGLELSLSFGRGAVGWSSDGGEMVTMWEGGSVDRGVRIYLVVDQVLILSRDSQGGQNRGKEGSLVHGRRSPQVPEIRYSHFWGEGVGGWGLVGTRRVIVKWC